MTATCPESKFKIDFATRATAPPPSAFSAFFARFVTAGAVKAESPR